jgi:outer membrane protein assembly factor BamD (BamD/ComL family)
MGTVGALALTAGCRSMLESPESARARGYTSEEPEDGWLFDRMTGRVPESANPNVSAASRQGPSQVVAATRVEPIPPEDLATAAPGVAWRPSETESEHDGDSGYGLSDFYPSNVVETFKEITGMAPNENVARALYREGQEFYRQGRFEEAAERFERGAKRAPESPLQEDCLFMLGESQFFSDRYPSAHDSYNELLTKYDHTRHLDKAVARQFSIGRYWEQLDAAEPAGALGFQLTDSTRPRFDAWGYALKAYESVLHHDPTGPLADKAVMATANAYFRKGRFEEAAYHYDLLRREYPKSEYQLNAHLDGMKSKLNMYQGPEYDGAPLKEAAKIADDTLVLFASELGDERNHVVQLKNYILEKRAERDWFQARYYEKKGYYRAARIYYQLILDDYPTTAFVAKARQRLLEIKDYPAEPANHFKWLTDLFPAADR